MLSHSDLKIFKSHFAYSSHILKFIKVMFSVALKTERVNRAFLYLKLFRVNNGSYGIVFE